MKFLISKALVDISRLLIKSTISLISKINIATPYSYIIYNYKADTNKIQNSQNKQDNLQ